MATAERIPGEDFIKLKLASVFLFTGYVANYEKPLDASLEFAEETMPKYGFQTNDLNEVKKIISDSFNDKLESQADMILHDSKYDYLGRVDFIKLTDRLLREESEYGIVHDRKQWAENQRQVLVSHKFVTETGRLLRSVSVEDQIDALQVYDK